jgi:hypothetical protein
MTEKPKYTFQINDRVFINFPKCSRTCDITSRRGISADFETYEVNILNSRLKNCTLEIKRHKHIGKAAFTLSGYTRDDKQRVYRNGKFGERKSSLPEIPEDRKPLYPPTPFELISTGGGCTAWTAPTRSGYVLITHANGCDAPESIDQPICVGWYDNESVYLSSLEAPSFTKWYAAAKDDVMFGLRVMDLEATQVVEPKRIRKVKLGSTVPEKLMQYINDMKIAVEQCLPFHPDGIHKDENADMIDTCMNAAAEIQDWLTSIVENRKSLEAGNDF